MTTNTEHFLDTASEPMVEQTAHRGGHLKAVALRAYSGHRGRQIGDDDIVALLPMVRKIAHRAVSYLKPPLSFDDLISAGTVGLMKAAHDFDTGHQAGFTTYAYIRVKGAILDELRRASLLPSSVTRQVRDTMQLSQEVAKETGSAPTEAELAERLSIPIEEVYKIFESARAQHFVSIDGLGDEQPALGQALAAPNAVRPDDRLEKLELLETLAQAMQELDERRLQVIVLYYHKHLTMKQIAEVLDITESRVSQLHASALVNLSAMLGDYNDGR